jgi:glycosyltransferase involved in cell wall biosynthesis
MIKALFLYTELAPYFLACVERLVKDHEVEVHIVRWPVNKEAPFDLRFADRVHVHDRTELNELSLHRLANNIDPDIVLASGWVDKGYLSVCRDFRKRGVPVVMCSDTAWRGDLRQWAAVGTSRFWLRRTFSHAWVTGEAQATYARFLGFPEHAIKRGFYSADVDRFAPIADRFAKAKSDRFPHRFLCVARYIATKGQQLLCDAFAELSDEGAAGDWELWFIGTGELEDAVKNSACGKHPRIKHIGFVQADHMQGYLEHTGVFILPSTYEPWGVVVHEHAVAGFPLLLSDAVGAGERFLKEDFNGARFRAGNKESLKASLRKIISTPDERLSRMGYSSAELGRSWSPKHWADVFMDICGSHRA